MNALIGISTVVGIVALLTILVRFIMIRISKSQKFSMYSWVLSAVIGFLWLFFVVFAQIQAAEAEKQVAMGTEAQAEAEKQAYAANIAQKEAQKQAQIAEELNAKLENCK